MTLSPAFPATDWERATPESQGVARAPLAEALERLRGVCGPLGLDRTLVIRRGRVIWEGADISTRVPVYSCTKSFMSACLGLLWDDGRCAPDDPAHRYHAPLRALYPGVTLQHLATFTSGYAHAPGDTFAPAAPRYPPGAAFQYSNQSDLLALILTRIAGEPLRDLFQRRIGRVIGLPPEEWEWRVRERDAGIEVNGGAGAPETGVHITARGFARFGWLAACRGTWADRTVLSGRYFDLAARPLVPARLPPADPAAWYDRLPGAYGLNWWVNGVTVDGRRLIATAPSDLFMAQGHMNSICFVVPSWQLVLVRLGPDVILWPRDCEPAFERLAAALRDRVTPARRVSPRA